MFREIQLLLTSRGIRHVVHNIHADRTLIHVKLINTLFFVVVLETRSQVAQVDTKPLRSQGWHWTAVLLLPPLPQQWHYREIPWFRNTKYSFWARAPGSYVTHNSGFHFWHYGTALFPVWTRAKVQNHDVLNTFPVFYFKCWSLPCREKSTLLVYSQFLLWEDSVTYVLTHAAFHVTSGGKHDFKKMLHVWAFQLSTWLDISHNYKGGGSSEKTQAGQERAREAYRM